MSDIKTTIEQIVKDQFGLTLDVVLTRPDPEHGDFATNAALQLAKQVGKNPRVVADQLAEQLRTTLADQVAEVTIAGPGFINLRLSDQTLLESLEQPIEQTRKGRVVIAETNNPNPFKAMHIGHAFNAVLGDTIANLIEASGAELHRASYHGDIGLHVGKSMYSLLRFVDGDIAKLKAVEPKERNSLMSRMYAEGSRAYKEDEVAKVEIDELTKQSFTREDPLYAEVYELCKAWSFEELDAIVARLGNKPVEKRFVESDSDPIGVAVVRANVPKVFQESDGALVFPGSKYGSFDNVFVTSRGLGLYGARDLGLMKLKNDYCKPDESYIVTAVEQKDYFIGVLAAAGLCLPELKDRTINISTGMVKLPSGKMSSRTGEVVEIAWLFDQVAETIRARGGDDSDQFVAGVLRYQFLKVRIGGDVIFDINEATSIEGNSGPYLQYAHARARSIISKTNTKPQTPESLEAGERLLIAKLTEYSGVASRASQEIAPHLICTYLYELAQTFNRFYEQNRVIGDPREAERLYLVQRYTAVLKAGLELLGIHAPEQM